MSPLTAHIRGHKMARGGLEAAVWDLAARLDGVPLWKKIGGGARREIPCGVSIGIQDSVEQLLEKIERELAAGYQRIKMKIKPGWDVDVVRRVRERFPAIKLMADANSAYTLADADHLRKLDDFYLMMIEQPLGHDDIIDHAELQAQLADAHLPGRVHPHARTTPSRPSACAPAASSTSSWAAWADFAEAKRVHDVAQAAGIPVWCGGMLEAGIGRAHNIALATLPNFVLPGDVSASKRYWKRDIIQPRGRDHAARHHRDPRRAGLRLRARPRLHPQHHGARGVARLNGLRLATCATTATTATPGSARWSAKSATTSTTSRSSAWRWPPPGPGWW